jgi:hypothetical protein
VSVGASGNGRNLAQNSKDLFVTHSRVLIKIRALQSWIRIRVKSTHGRDRADQDTHRMSVVSECLHQFDQIFMNESVAHDGSLPLFLLNLIRNKTIVKNLLWHDIYIAPYSYNNLSPSEGLSQIKLTSILRDKIKSPESLGNYTINSD